jgi:hypothetical protein
MRVVDSAEPEPDARAGTAFLHSTSLFCDDIRLEATGKLNLVGCYPGNVIIASPHQPIDRLFIYTRLVWGHDFDPTGLRLRVDMPGQEPSFMEVQSITPATPESPGVAACVMNLRFPPLRVGDRLQVHIDAGAHTAITGELFVVPPPTTTRH